MTLIKVTWYKNWLKNVNLFLKRDYFCRNSVDDVEKWCEILNYDKGRTERSLNVEKKQKCNWLHEKWDWR